MSEWHFAFNDDVEIAFNDGTVVAIDTEKETIVSLRQSILYKLRSVLPLSWFPVDAPILDMVLTGFAWCIESLLGTIADATKQLRLQTATGGYLELASNDFFGPNLPRWAGESDALYSARVIRTIFRDKCTYAALYNALIELPVLSESTIAIFEKGPVEGKILLEDGSNLLLEDSGTLNMESVLRTVPDGAVAVGLETADAIARYGTDLEAYEALVSVSNAPVGGLLLEDGTNLLLEDGGKLNTEFLGSGEYINAVIDVIKRVKPIGTVVWVSIS